MSRRSRRAAKADSQIPRFRPLQDGAETAPFVLHKTGRLEIRRVSAGNELASAHEMTPKRFVYVLKTQDSRPRYYVGLTSDVEQRLDWHNQGQCTHTAKYRPWQSHVVVQFSDEAHATSFERYLKSGSGRAFAKRHFD